MKEIVNLFALSVYQTRLGLSPDARRRMAAAIEDQKRERTVKKGARETWPGDVNGFNALHGDPRFDAFFAALPPHFERYLDALGLRSSDYEIYVTRSWGTVTDKDERILLHTHNKSDISVVYYVTYPENSGALLFKDGARQNELTPGVYSPFRGQLEKHKSNMLTASTAKLVPAEDMLFLFPSKTSHGTEPSRSDATRVSIAVDTLITVADPTGEEFLLPPVDSWKRT